MTATFPAPPNTTDDWDRAYTERFQQIKNITLEDLQTLREKRASGSTLTFNEFLLLRALFPDGKEWDTLAAALIRVGLIDEETWRFVEDVLFRRTDPNRSSISSPQWYSMDLPMAPLFNLLLCLQHEDEHKELLACTETLDEKLRAFRTILTDISTVTSVFSTSTKRRGLGPISDKNKHLAEILFSQKSRCKEEDEEDEKPHNESLNVNFFCNLLNMVINRARDYEKRDSQLLLSLVRSPAFVPDQKEFKLREVLTTRVDATMSVPIEWGGSTTLNVEAKRSDKGNHQLPYQIAGQLTTQISTRRADFQHIGGTSEWHVPHIQVAGTEVTVYIASFRPPFLKYVGSVKQCTKSKLDRLVNTKIEAEWKGRNLGKKMPADYLKRQRAAVFRTAEESANKQLAKCQTDTKDQKEIMRSWLITSELNDTYSTKSNSVPTKPSQHIPSQHLPDEFLSIQGYGPFSLTNTEQLEMLLKICVALDIAARKRQEKTG